MGFLFNSYIFIAFFLVLVLGFWVVGLFFGLHFIFWWYDVVAHFAGGAWIVSVVFLFKKQFGMESEGARLPAIFVAAVGVAALTGVLWEFFEVILDRYITGANFTYLPNVFEDTLWDLFWDLAGGSAMFFMAKSGLNKKHE